MSIPQFVPFALGWVIVGFLVLPLFVIWDVVRLFIIFCNYSDEEDWEKKKQMEDDRQDKIMVYNEVIDVMKAIQFISMKKLTGQSSPSNLHDMNMDSPNRDHELWNDTEIIKCNSIRNTLEDTEDSQDIRFLIDKSLIIETWKRYRPNEVDFLNKEGENSTSAKISNMNFISVVGSRFVDKIIENINHNNDKGEMDDVSESSFSSSEQTVLHHDIPDIEIQVIDEFLRRFSLSSESQQNETINLKLALKALPKRVSEYNEAKIDMIGFSAIQLSLIAFQNDDKDELHNFYDRRSMKRLFKLRSKAKENNSDMELMNRMSDRLLLKAKMMFNNQNRDKNSKSEANHLIPKDVHAPHQSTDKGKSNIFNSETVSDF